MSSQSLLNFWEQLSDQVVGLPVPSASRSTASSQLFWFPPLPCPGLQFSFLVKNSSSSQLVMGQSGELEDSSCWYLEDSWSYYLDDGTPRPSSTQRIWSSQFPATRQVELWKIIVLTHYLQLYSQRSSLKGQPAVPGPLSNTQSVYSCFITLRWAVSCQLLRKGFWTVAPVLAVCIFIICYAKI